jgi:hypothetical protein
MTMGPRPLLFHCGSSDLSLDVDMSISVQSLKSLVSSSFRISPSLAIIQSGDFVRGDAPLSQVLHGDTLTVIPLPSVFSLTVHFGDRRFPIQADPYSPVSDLRSAIASRVLLHPDQFHLVSAGQILQDHFTLSYHDLVPNSTVYVVPIKSNPRGQAHPLALLESVKRLVQLFASNRGVRRREIATEISELIYNPILKSYARLDPAAKQILDEAYLAVNFTQPRSTASRDGVLAAINDMAMTQYDGSHEGMAFLVNEYRRSQNSEFTRIDSPVNLEFTPAISERGLPIWWLPEKMRDSEQRRVCLKENFSEQVRVLKRMGFGDEAVIRIALRHTAGNVTRAAKYLMRTGGHRA